jgi:methylated-DNA-[protein]-cysteine S-methyltransferase
VREISYGVDGWGTGTIWLDVDTVVWHELPVGETAGFPHDPPSHQSRARPAGSSTGRSPATLERTLVERFQSYFRGERVSFNDIPIDLEWCTPFQRAVADELRALPYGEVVTYGELAALAGYPNAQRAAGTFCAHNRLPLVIPCHRVLSAGGIGGYGLLGPEFKRRLLALEGVAL